MDLYYVNGNKMKENKNNKFDEYYTKREVSEKLYLKTREIISRYDNIDRFTWLEPSVGEGCFFDLLPENNRIGVDINPKRNDVIHSDYLKYELPNNPLIVIGNPPFGHRGVLALEFINHSQSAEYVAMILPMFFQSVGKGSIRYRVQGFNLLYEEKLPKNSFYLKDGKDIDVKCCFQIWSKNHRLEKEEFSWYNCKKQEPFAKLVEVKTVSLAPKRECGKEWIYEKKPDYYLSSSYFRDNKVVKNFDEVKYKSGIAIIYKTKNKRTVAKLNKTFTSANWDNYSNLATNGCRHVGKAHIFNLLKDTFGETLIWK